jgi:hypothetical protein
MHAARPLQWGGRCAPPHRALLALVTWVRVIRPSTLPASAWQGFGLSAYIDWATGSNAPAAIKMFQHFSTFQHFFQHFNATGFLSSLNSIQ